MTFAPIPQNEPKRDQVVDQLVKVIGDIQQTRVIEQFSGFEDRTNDAIVFWKSQIKGARERTGFDTRAAINQLIEEEKASFFSVRLAGTSGLSPDFNEGLIPPADLVTLFEKLGIIGPGERVQDVIEQNCHRSVNGSTIIIGTNIRGVTFVQGYEKYDGKGLDKVTKYSRYSNFQFSPEAVARIVRI